MCCAKRSLGEKRAQRQPGGDGLGNANHVRHDAEVLEGEELPGTPQSALDLVEDERGLVLVGQLAARLQKFGRRFLDATLALDGLQHDTANLVVHRIAQRFHIVARHEAHAFQHGIEVLAILCLAGERERPHGASVKGILQRDDDALFRASRGVARSAHQLQRAFNRLGTAVGEKGAIQSRLRCITFRPASPGTRCSRGWRRG